MASQRLQQLDQRLAELGLRAEDLVERFVRASGPGGQHVNRTSTAVQLVHLPSGLEARAEGERSQHQNRVAAREQLIARVEAQRAAAAAAQRAAAERERRRRRRPPPGARRVTVADKRRRGALKRQRGPAAGED